MGIHRYQIVTVQRINIYLVILKEYGIMAILFY
jgi:hypothetical protein